MNILSKALNDDDIQHKKYYEAINPDIYEILNCLSHKMIAKVKMYYFALIYYISFSQTSIKP